MSDTNAASPRPSGKVSCCGADSTLRTYPAPAGAALNDTFTVEVRSPGGPWQKLDVYDVRVDLYSLSHCSFVSFDFSGRVEVRVTANKEQIQSFELRPRSFQLTAAKGPDANAITFTLDRPRNLSVEINGDRLHNLQVFANPMEVNPPSPTDPNVIYFAPGLHTNHQVIRVPSNTTVYLAGGAIVQGIIVTDDHATNITIRGRGILDMTPWNEAKGYFIKGHSWQAATVNLRWTKHCLLEGIILKQHTDYAVMGGEVEDVTIDNIKCFSSHEWADGIDMMSSRSVRIRNCYLRTSDDCIAVYASRRDYNGNTCDWEISDCVFWADRAHPIHIGIHGSFWEDGDVIENIRFRNIDILENICPYEDFWGALAITCGDKNTVRSITFEDIRVEHIRDEGGNLVRLTFRFYEPSVIAGRRIENILFKNISYNGSLGSYLDADKPGQSIDGVVFDNLVINGQHVTNAEQGKVTIGKNVTNVTFR